MPIEPGIIQFIEPDQQCPEAVDPSETTFVDKALFVDLLVEESSPTGFLLLPVPVVLLDVGNHAPALDGSSK